MTCYSEGEGTEQRSTGCAASPSYMDGDGTEIGGASAGSSSLFALVPITTVPVGADQIGHPWSPGE
jgi:hypothetical protein